MKRRIAILRTVAVGTLVVALGGAAIGASNVATVASSNAANESGTAAEHATLNVDVGSVAARVVELIAGGSNPSTMNKHDAKAEKTRAKAEKVKAEEAEEADEATEANDNDKDNDKLVELKVAEGQKVGQTGTAGTRPGWGCGDTNHTHSGPPGRPGATPPPGCTKK